jgi:hypothetical protein
MLDELVSGATESFGARIIFKVINIKLHKIKAIIEVVTNRSGLVALVLFCPNIIYFNFIL